VGLPPNFKDYRTSNDGVMVADIGFKKQLWALDPELDVVWDWASEKWEIWRFPGQGSKPKKLTDPRATHVMTIQTKKRTFRELGADIILSLQAGDTSRFSLNQLVDYFNKMDDNIQRAKEKQLTNKISDITRESSDYMRGVLKIQVPKRFQSGWLINGPTNTLKIGRILASS